MGFISYILVIVAVPLLLSIITVSRNVVAANYTNSNIHNSIDNSYRINQRRRHLTNNNAGGGDNLTTFIVGGNEINKGDFPYLVSIGNSGRRGGHGKYLVDSCCGGDCVDMSSSQ